jgi:4-azaleucine resistance transporter AzlC
LEERVLAKKVETTDPRWLYVLGISMPLCLSYIPIGLACGILLHAAGFNFVMALLVSIVVFSGGAQFLIASLLMVNAPLASIIIMLFFLELRYALLGSSLSKYLSNETHRFILLFSASMNDENYAINYLKFATDKNWTPQDALMVEHYSLIAWASGNLVGALIGSAVSIDLEIVDFALTALFLYMIVMQVQSNLTFLMALLSAVLSLVFLTWTKSTLGIVLATVLASLCGFYIESRVRKHSADPNHTLLLRKFVRPENTRDTIEDEQAKRELRERQQQKGSKDELGSKQLASHEDDGGHDNA